jgi:hypothetical protein
MTIGKGVASSSSNKVKCNMQNSTETELISLHNELPEVVWTRYFVEYQGYEIDECVIYQDNMSALSLEKNERILSSKRIKHIKAKFFPIKDYYKMGEIDVQNCPTDVMRADLLTKPLQGQKFRDMCTFVQNCPRDYDDDIELQTDELAQKTMKQQVKTVFLCGSVFSCWLTRHRRCLVGRQDKGLPCVLQTHQHGVSKNRTTWTNQPSGQKICMKQHHVDPCGQKIC